MISTRKKHQHKKQISLLNKTLNDFVIGNNANASSVGNDNLEPQSSSLANIFGRNTIGENSASQNQVFEKNADRIRKAVDNAVMTVRNWVHDTIWKAVNNVIKQRVEMAVRSITESSGRRHNSAVQNLDQRENTRKTESTLPMSTSRQIDLNVDQNSNDEARNV